MIDWKSYLKKFLYPPIWLIIPLLIFSCVAIPLILLKGWDLSPIAYIAYVIAFYTVSVLTLRCIRVFPDIRRSVRQKVHDNQFGHRFFTDAAFKTTVLLYASLTINLLYVLLNLFSSIYYQTLWFAILSGYYTILAAMRFLLVRFVNRNGIGKNLTSEYRRSRLCGIILMTVNLTLSGAVLMILYQNKGYSYGGILIYVMASYTFYVTIHSIVDIIKYRKYNSPVLSAAKMINFSAALVSMLALETAMLSEFGEESTPEFRWIMIASTGAGVSLIVIAMSAYMIVTAYLAIHRHKKKATQSEIESDLSGDEI